MGKHIMQGPFQHAGTSARRIDVAFLLALLPAVILHFWSNGLESPVTLIACYTGSLALQIPFMPKSAKTVSEQVRDPSLPLFVVLTVLILPAGFPSWAVITAVVLANLLLRQCFGGPGNYPLNPVATAILLAVILAQQQAVGVNVSSESLLITQPGFIQAMLTQDELATAELQNLLLIAAALTLMARGFINWRIPLAMSFAIGLLMAASINDIGELASIFLHGELVLFVFFLAPETTTAARGPRGRLLYGALASCLYFLFHTEISVVAAMAAATIFANLWAPLLDYLCRHSIPGASRIVIDPEGNKP